MNGQKPPERYGNVLHFTYLGPIEASNTYTAIEEVLLYMFGMQLVRLRFCHGLKWLRSLCRSWATKYRFQKNFQKNSQQFFFKFCEWCHSSTSFFTRMNLENNPYFEKINSICWESSFDLKTVPAAGPGPGPPFTIFRTAKNAKWQVGWGKNTKI